MSWCLRPSAIASATCPLLAPWNGGSIVEAVSRTRWMRSSMSYIRYSSLTLSALAALRAC
eukprot:2136320-Heterocapsa_arctica.AAC.1